MNIVANFCRELPKIELHAHLNGSLSAETLTQLGCLPEDTKKYQKKSETLDECFELFKIAHNSTKNTQSIYTATTNVIKEFHKDNVIYLEIRSTPREENCMSKIEYVESIVSAIKNYTNENQGIIVKLLLSFDRKDCFETAKRTMDLIVTLHEKYPNIIKGVDFSGNPKLGAFNKDLFSIARNNGLSISLHCNEIKNDEEVKNMLNFQPERLGHGTFIHPDHGGCKENWDLLTKFKIPVECCLSSNVCTGISKNYDRHHLRELIKDGLPFSINTDDKGVFSTTLSEEYEIAAKTLNLSPKEMYLIACNSIDQAFAAEQEKQILQNQLENWKNKNAHYFI